jgi:HK97 family phage portal protein
MQPFKRALDFISRKSYEVLFYNDPHDETHERRNWSKRDYLNANEISLYTNRAITKRAEKVSEVKFTLVNRKTKAVIEDNPLLTLLNKPNDLLTGLQFWGLYQKYRDLTGAAYIWMEPGSEIFNPAKVSALHLLRSDCVSLVYGPEGEIAAFKYASPNGKSTDFPAEQIIYLHTPDPLRPTEGTSLLKAGRMAIDTEVQLSKYHANVIRNGGNVGNVMKFKTPNLTKAQVTELKQQYDLQYAEAKNSGKPMFLAGDADIVNLGLSPVELSYLESKRLTLDDICIMTGVPKAVLAVSTGETFSNADASVGIFLRETINPQLTDLVTILDWRFIPEEYDLGFKDPTPENVELKLKRIETGFKNSYMTINEAREFENLPPVPDGDEILIPINMIPLSDAGKQAVLQPVDPNSPNPADQRLPSDKGAVKGPHPLKDAFIRERYGKLMVKRMDRQEGRVLSAIQEYFNGQRRRVIENIEGARTFRRKDILDEAFNHELELRLAKGALLPLLKDILKRAGVDAAEFGGASRPFHLSSRVESSLDMRANIFANQITETTFDDLKSAFADSLAAGESRQQLVGRIRSVYDGYSEGRAYTIARTETHNAVQTGTMEGYKQAGLETKIWVAVGDEKTRDSHLAVDGEEVPLDQMFSNGLAYPGDPSGAPEEVINCRCSI